MEPEIKKMINDCEKKLDAIYESTEKTRKYFLWTLILSLVFFILPLVGIALVVPFFLESITGNLEGFI